MSMRLDYSVSVVLGVIEMDHMLKLVGGWRIFLDVTT